MKTITKLSLVMLMVFSTTLVFSQALITYEEDQVGVDANAMFEVRNDPNSPLGMLIPKVDFDLNGAEEVILDGMESPTDGIMVYNIGTNVPKGLWYFDESDGLSGRWILYTKSGTIYSGTIDNYGELYEDQPDGPGTGYVLSNSGWTSWNSSTEGRNSDNFNPFTGDDTQTQVPGNDPDYLAIASGAKAADYSVNFSMVVKSSSSGIPFRAQLYIVRFVGGEERVKGAFVKHYFQTGGEYATLSTSALIDLGAGDRVEVRMKTDNANETIIVEGANLRLAKIGEID